MRLILTICLLSLLPMQAWGCIDKLVEPKISHDELIQNSNFIYLATLISATLNDNDSAILNDVRRRTINYTFDYIDFIKGDHLEKSFMINEGVDFKGEKLRDYSAHNDNEFWSKKFSGRVIPTCAVSGYGYAVGVDYLFFTDDLSMKGENIKAIMPILFKDHDKWLQYVRDKVKEQAAND